MERGRGVWGMISNCESVWVGNLRLWYCPERMTVLLYAPRHLDMSWRLFLAVFFYRVPCGEPELEDDVLVLQYEGAGVEDIPQLLEILRRFAKQAASQQVVATH